MKQWIIVSLVVIGILIISLAVGLGVGFGNGFQKFHKIDIGRIEILILIYYLNLYLFQLFHGLVFHRRIFK